MRAFTPIAVFHSPIVFELRALLPIVALLETAPPQSPIVIPFISASVPTLSDTHGTNTGGSLPTERFPRNAPS